MDKKVTEIMSEVIDWLQQIGLSDKDPLLLCVLGVALLALLGAVRNHFRIRASAGGQVERLRKKVGEMEIHLRDALNRFEVAQLETQREVLQLREALNDLAAEVSPEVVVEEKPPVSDELVLESVKKKSEVAAEEQYEPEEPHTLVSGLQKTRKHFFQRFREVFAGKKRIGPETYEALEELLLSGDLGVRTTQTLLLNLQEEVQRSGELDEEQLRRNLKQSILNILRGGGTPEIIPRKVDGKPCVVLVVGVNGVGKTTTIGKLAAQFKAQGAKVLLGACDTFRAAAVEQIEAWGRRAGVEVVTGENASKPSAVAYQAVHKAQDDDYDVLILDTAGRLHTRVNLMRELSSVVQIIGREQPGSPHETILVLDASTGQNALQQARVFHEQTNLTGIVITKLDGTPKGGILIAIRDELGIPIRYVGVGESMDDLKPFSAKEFVDALFSEGEYDGSDPDAAGGDSLSGKKAQARRRRRERAWS